MFACPNCGKAVEQQHDKGRPRKWCSASCRTMASRRARKEADAATIRRADDVRLRAVLAALEALCD